MHTASHLVAAITRETGSKDIMPVKSMVISNFRPKFEIFVVSPAKQSTTKCISFSVVRPSVCLSSVPICFLWRHKSCVPRREHCFIYMSLFLLYKIYSSVSSKNLHVLCHKSIRIMLQRMLHNAPVSQIAFIVEWVSHLLSSFGHRY